MDSASRSSTPTTRVPGTVAGQILLAYLEREKISVREAARQIGEPNHSRLDYIIYQAKAIPQDVLEGIARAYPGLAVELINAQRDQAVQALGLPALGEGVFVRPIVLGSVESQGRFGRVGAILRESLAALRGADRARHEHVTLSVDVVVEELELCVPRGHLIPLEGLGAETVRALQTVWAHVGQRASDLAARTLMEVEIGETHATELLKRLRLQEEEFAIVDPVQLAAQPYRRQENHMDTKRSPTRVGFTQSRVEPTVTPLHGKAAGMSKNEIKTGADLTRYREAYGLSDEQISLAINRALACVKRWQANGEKPLNVDILDSLRANFDDNGGLVGGWDRPDAVRENFMDDEGDKRRLLFALKKYFNEIASNEHKGLDRIALTGVPEVAGQYGAGAIWMANDEPREGRQVGDWLLRRIVKHFHENPPTQSTYPFDDGDRDRQWCVLAQNILDDDEESTGFCVIAVATDPQPDPAIYVTMNALRKEIKKYIASVSKL